MRCRRCRRRHRRRVLNNRQWQPQFCMRTDFSHQIHSFHSIEKSKMYVCVFKMVFIVKLIDVTLRRNYLMDHLIDTNEEQRERKIGLNQRNELVNVSILQSKLFE